MTLGHFHEVWTCDFEFISKPGERPLPVCCVAHELHSGRRVRLWQDQLERPFADFGRSDILLVAYFASAEIGCFLALQWPMPRRVLDLFTEFRNLTNGCTTLAGNSLLGALAHFGIDSIGVTEKSEMRDLILGGGPWSHEERRAILDYCESDVIALDKLLPAMLPGIDLPRALHRGRYMAANAHMEWNGVPIDSERLGRFMLNWDKIKSRAIIDVDASYEVYEDGSFRHDRFQDYLERHKISWPLLESGKLDLTDDTFREMARIFPVISPLRELRHMLSEMRLCDLAVGSDQRNRCMLSPFGARTGRNTPSNTAYIFGPSVWLRSLIRPTAGRALAYIDWNQQEFGIMAALSGDSAMLEAYQSGDCYLAFAKQAGAIPQDATKESHRGLRELYKQVILAVSYGMGSWSLGFRTDRPEIVARQLLWDFQETYPTFWKWADNVVSHAILHGWQQTVFGWMKWLPAADANPRSLRNFPAQANGAEMLRLACCLGIERGVKICAPVHDAVLIEAPESQIEANVADMQSAMEEASRIILGDLTLSTDAKIIRYPDRYHDPRGDEMWRKVTSILDEHAHRHEYGLEHELELRHV